MLIQGGTAAELAYISQQQRDSVSDLVGDDYEVLEAIGKGAYAIVWKAVHRPSGGRVAVKVLPAARGKAALAQAEAVSCLEQMDHPNILRLRKVFKAKGRSEAADGINSVEEKLVEVMDLIEPQQDIFQCLARTRRLFESDVRWFAFELIQAVEAMHMKGVIHRDLKPENIMVERSIGKNSGLRIIDFGFARRCDGLIADGVFVGTPLYMSPELHLKQSYGPKCDMWAIGVMIYTLLSGILPFDIDERDELVDQICNGDLEFPPTYFSNVSNDAMSLVSGCLERTAPQRFSATAALEHRWFKSMGDVDDDGNAPAEASSIGDAEAGVGGAQTNGTNDLRGVGIKCDKQTENATINVTKNQQQQQPLKSVFPNSSPRNYRRAFVNAQDGKRPLRIKCGKTTQGHSSLPRSAVAEDNGREEATRTEGDGVAGFPVRPDRGTWEKVQLVMEACHDFVGSKENEISVSKGDMVLAIGIAASWCKVKTMRDNGQVEKGVVPRRYLTVVDSSRLTKRRDSEGNGPYAAEAADDDRSTGIMFREADRGERNASTGGLEVTKQVHDGSGQRAEVSARVGRQADSNGNTSDSVHFRAPTKAWEVAIKIGSGYRLRCKKSYVTIEPGTLIIMFPRSSREHISLRLASFDAMEKGKRKFGYALKLTPTAHSGGNVQPADITGDANSTCITLYTKTHDMLGPLAVAARQHCSSFKHSRGDSHTYVSP